MPHDPGHEVKHGYDWRILQHGHDWRILQHWPLHSYAVLERTLGCILNKQTWQPGASCATLLCMHEYWLTCSGPARCLAQSDPGAPLLPFALEQLATVCPLQQTSWSSYMQYTHQSGALESRHAEWHARVARAVEWWKDHSSRSSCWEPHALMSRKREMQGRE